MVGWGGEPKRELAWGGRARHGGPVRKAAADGEWEGGLAGWGSRRGAYGGFDDGWVEEMGEAKVSGIVTMWPDKA